MNEKRLAYGIKYVWGVPWSEYLKNVSGHLITAFFEKNNQP